jgi:glycosyltransferase involved in cell wall biosynthesis
VNKKRLSISLVIPAYNEDNHIGRCLESVAGQSIRPSEVIVVDNNSTDKTRAVAEKYSFVRIITEAKQGIIFARRAGFNAAKGDIIGSLDADAVLPNNWVEHISDFFDAKPKEDVAWTSGARFYNVRLPKFVSAVYNFLIFDINRLLIGQYTLWGSSMAITKSQWLRMKSGLCARTDIHEDLDLAIHFHEEGVRIFYDRRVRVKALLRGARAGHQDLWEYLQWWPNTLRIHHKKAWPIVWFFGAVVVYCLTPYFSISDKLAKLLK